MDNAANPVDIKKREERGKKNREMELNDLRIVLNTEAGKRVFGRILRKGRILKTSFTEPNAMWVSFNEGMRQVSLELLADLEEAQPDAYNKIREFIKEISNG